jgi:hypothetical protein
MRRRDFFEKSGCGLFGMMLAYFGLTSCAKKEETPTATVQAEAPAEEAPEEMSREEMVKKMLVEKKGLTEEEADVQIAEFKDKLPMVKEKCICKTCPTYVAEETESAFCHPLIGKSKIITEEKGCDCPKCPVYKEMNMKNGYYCTRKSELEQEMAKMG